uniref:Zgc:113274 n=1 Tax=Sinocyclocheilus anshuiensis TaxID=1608454 RepID=A0A671MYJ8_9TELE
MPRNYIRKTDWGSVTYEELEKAFVEVKRGKSIRTVAKERKIGRSTLQRYMKKAEEKREKTVGYRGTAEARRILSEELEEELAENIRKLGVHGLTPKRCREIAFEFAQKNNIPVPNNWGEQRLAGRDWLSSFITRHNLYGHITEAASLGSHGQVISFSLIKKEIQEECDVPVPIPHASEEDSAEMCDSDRDLLDADLFLT